jgi:hypothetical protein
VAAIGVYALLRLRGIGDGKAAGTSEPSSGPVSADSPRGETSREARGGDRRDSGAEPGARGGDPASVAARGGEGP